MVIVTLLLACGGGSDSGSALVGDAANGATLYGQTCETCHGADGTAGVGGAADLNFEVNDQTDAELADVIQNGFGDMPAQGLDDQETADVIAYLHQTFDQ